MKRKKAASMYEGKSLKTFFLYAIAVILVISIALAIKLFFVIRVSKFDGQHQFIIAVAEQGKVQQIIAFNPSDDTTDILQIQNSQIQIDSLGKTLPILPNARIDFSQDVSLNGDVTQSLWQIISHYSLAKKDFTFYDLGRLFLLSRSVTQVNRQEQSITLPLGPIQSDKLISSLFTDSALSQENLTIQIINATDVSGLGQRLERALEDQGANIVAISTSQSIAPHSTIQYFGDGTYTLDKLATFLNFPVTKFDKQAIADIVITIGEDQKDTKKF